MIEALLKMHGGNNSLACTLRLAELLSRSQ